MAATTLRHPTLSRRRLCGSAALLALFGATACAGLRASAATWAPQPYRLYLGDAATPKRLLPLDPLTLADRPAAPVIPLDAPWGAFSADGSTLVDVALAPDTTSSTITVRRGPALARFARFPSPAAVTADVRLSRDGGTLVLQHQRRIADGQPQPDIWYVVDVATGRLRSTVRSMEANTWPLWWIDPAATRLYQPVVTLTMADTAPKPLHLVAHDLDSGAEVGRLTLPHVLVGTWRPGGTIDGEPIVRQQYPALALSHAGDALLIYQPYPATLTVVDANQLKVTGTVSPDGRSGALAAVLAALPLWPQPVEAKATDGANLQGTASPNGRSLYVWGDVTGGPAAGSPPYGSAGLRRIDLRTVAVAAQAMPGARLFGVTVAPDGRSVYTYASKSNTDIIDSPAWPALLRRHDATTLAVTATRAFSGYRPLMLRPG